MDMAKLTHGLNIGLERHGETIFLSLKIIGTLSHEDYTRIIPIIESAICNLKHPQVNVLIDADELTGLELRAAWDDLKIGLKHNNDFGKIAIYGHKKLQAIMVKMTSWFISGEAKYFEDKTAALNWLFD
ncbi:hypothetical protein PTD2_19542 [Pseudoalteromonas tunicata D2]|jgi:hypothetical protein|uniref:STAS/SEC14 domain-containing protein n=2 Tax=Pseudoalteromonas tunicata TaxID=314281 RepID=A4C9I4_9GAMM|nr:hypothetical protein PTD2_19542 [Pseudoalteromonas tunicata D2]